jgi:thiosulfate/3-mercaptopyruvate sulfurtransferase
MTSATGDPLLFCIIAHKLRLHATVVNPSDCRYHSSGDAMTYTTLIDAATAREHLEDPDWLFVDCRFDIRDTGRGPRDYGASHIPGAVYADLDKDLSGRIIPGRTGRHPLPDPASIVESFSGWGIVPRTQVIAYDESTGAIAAARLWWLLKWAGHDAAAVLDGGIKAWTLAGLPCSSGSESRSRSTFVAAFRPEMAVNALYVRSVLDDPGWVVLDARAADRYRGENETIDTAAGHILGAVSAPYASALGPDGLFKPVSEIARLYRSAMGGRDAEHTIVYCGSGVTAAHSVLACAHAGIGLPRLYPGSWSDWITDKDRPMAR